MPTQLCGVPSGVPTQLCATEQEEEEEEEDEE